MKKAFIILLLAVCTGCMFIEVPQEYSVDPGYSFTPETQMDHQSIPSLLVNSTLHIQYSGEIDLNQPVDVYDLDLFETDADEIRQLHARGIFVICYFSAGSFEDWRPDTAHFPREILGKDMVDWPGEIWLDIRQIERIKPIIKSRLDMAFIKGCDGVDPDNVNGFEQDTGFPLKYENQLTYNIYLSNAAHERGLAIGLKNDLSQIPDLLSRFEWTLNEECFSYRECEALSPFIQAGKPVFVIEYELDPQEFCPQANELNFNAQQKNRELDAFYIPCK